ncbi:hypothetical protein PR048_013520 [Dryococelus australis]|uniref:HTH psq-type domain-containing protein n=1 Tax=Dryococelus australis TaxID=614101 RepID=A0ABQ9HT79_9NEOP|nr:hypothetical protein PR048_013520 [Dryococelus australis]
MSEGHASPPGRTWDAHKLEEAIKAIRNKTMGWKKVAKVFGVPETTWVRLTRGITMIRNKQREHKWDGLQFLDPKLKRN